MWLEKAAVILYAAAALGTGAAFWAGERAADSLAGGLAPQIQLHVNQHSDWAHYTIWLVGILVGLRFGVAIWDRQGLRVRPRLLLLLVAMVGVGLSFKTADLGGGLVYQHRVAVTPESLPSEAVDSPDVADGGSRGPEERLIYGVGTVAWNPQPEDRQALGTVVKPAPGSTLEAIAWQEPSGQDERGLALRVDGRALLLLPGAYDDVQIEADLDLSDWDGTVGLAHHVRSATEAGVFTVSAPSGGISLAYLNGDREEVLDRSTQQLGPGPLNFAVFAAGRHFRGMLNSEVVAHGHRPPLPEGGCGLLVEGKGIIRILAMKIFPISESPEGDG